MYIVIYDFFFLRNIIYEYLNLRVQFFFKEIINFGGKKHRNIILIIYKKWCDRLSETEKERVRAFPLNILKNLAFTTSKTNFITYNTSLYNIPYIKTSIFLTLYLNILSLSFFIFFYSSFLDLCLSLLSVSLSQPSTANHHIHPPISQPQHPPTIVATSHQPDPPQPQTIAQTKKKKNLHIQSHWIKESQNHNKDPKPPRSIYTHLWTTLINQPTPISKPPRSTYTQHPKPPRSTHEPSHQNQEPIQNQSKPLKLKITNIKSQNSASHPDHA